MTRKKLFSVTLDDCRVETFTVGGNGGSGKDTSNTGVRITHEPSGAVGRCIETRSQLHNKRTAFRRMAQSSEFILWAKLESHRHGGRSIAAIVEDEMKPENLKIEVRTPEGWRVEN